MKISRLLKNVPVLNEYKDTEISHICTDSRKLFDGAAFVCIRGAVSDGHDFARTVYDKGIRVFVAESDLGLPSDATVVLTKNTRLALAEMAQSFYGDPSKELKVIGITGTKGKTTTAGLIYHILNANGIKTGYIGTNGVKYGKVSFETANTTPESIDLAEYMRKMVDDGVKYLVLEVSSQAIYFDRICGMTFDTCIFTNLSPDHIGPREHPSFEHYRDSKKRLFTEYAPKVVIYNSDDASSEYMMEGSSTRKFGYSREGRGDFNASNIKYLRSAGMLGTEFDISFGQSAVHVKLPLPGDFNAMNMLAAFGACIGAGVSPTGIAKAAETAVFRGRFEVVDALPYATFVIDYAHNGLSLESALKVLRAYEPHRLICVFGSVGGRTEMRRAELGRAASRYADLSILTSDNPDDEDPMKIIDDIAAAFEAGGGEYIKIPSRREAVLTAVSMAQKGDILLFAGKGHEDYQLVHGKKEYFSERETIVEGAFAMLLGR